MSDGERSMLAAELKRALGSATATLSSRVEGAMQIQPPATVRSIVSAAVAAGSMSFTLPLLRAVLAGLKTETRRPVRPAPADVRAGVPVAADGLPIVPLCRLGDRLWVREKWARIDDGRFVYAVDGPTPGVRWNSSRFMPRAAARTWLDVTGVDVRRLATITDAEALREGVEPTLDAPRAAFLRLWDSIFGEGDFAAANDPWVWVVAFEIECRGQNDES